MVVRAVDNGIGRRGHVGRWLSSVSPVWQANFLTTTYGWSWSGSAWVSSPAGLTYSGQSNKYMFDSTGTLTTGPNNQVFYSNTFNGTGWGGASASATANTITFTGNSSYWASPIVLTAGGTTVIAGVTMSVASGTATIALRSGSTGLGVKVVTVTTTPTVFYTYPFAALSSESLDIDNRSIVGGGGTAVTLNVSNAFFSSVTYETAPRPQDQVITQGTAFFGPRQDYQYNGSSWVPAGMLVEGASSGNLLKTTGDFTTGSYTKSGLTSITQSTTAPDGVSLWNLITENTANATHGFYGTNFSTSNGVQQVFSVFVKAGTQRYISLRGEEYAHPSGSNYPWITFDTTNATIDANAGVSTSGVQNLGGGVYRIYLSWVNSASQSSGNMVIGGSNISTAPSVSSVLGNSYTGTSQTFYAWGAQIEAGSVPTSYLPNPTTTTPGATRAADVFNEPTYASNATIWQRLSESTLTTARTYYAPSALPEPFTTGYWYQSMAAYPRPLTTAEQTPRLVNGANY